MAGRRDPQRTSAQAPLPRPFGCDRGSGDRLAARGDRRRAQLGLPLLLGARLSLHARRPPAPRLLGRGGGVLLVAAARIAAHSPASAGPYRLDGGEHAPEHALELDGYRGSRPVRVGNEAAGQTQLGIYGDVLQAALIYGENGGRLDRETGRRLAGIADLVCRIWRQPDSGIWEVRSSALHFTHSKMMCWIALDRALRLSDAGHVPAGHASRWRREALAIREFIETRCWSRALDSYARYAGGAELDA